MKKTIHELTRLVADEVEGSGQAFILLLVDSGTGKRQGQLGSNISSEQTLEFLREAAKNARLVQ